MKAKLNKIENFKGLMKTVDKFSHTEKGIRRTSYPLVPCGSRVLFTSGEFVEILRFMHFTRYKKYIPYWA